MTTVIGMAFGLAACSSASADGTATTTATDDASSDGIAGTTVTLATDANYPPCEWIDDSGEMVGFEPDIWNAIADRIGVTLEVENTDFDSLIPGVQSGRYDLAMECISDRAEREEQVTFLDFIYAETAVITTADYDGPINDTDPLSVCGESMGAQTGFDTVSIITDTINPQCADAGLDEVTVNEFPSAADTYNALYSGRVDFVVQDTAAAAYLNQSSPVDLVVHHNSELPKLYLGMIFNQDDDAMIQAWQQGLQEIVDDGTYESILDDWDISPRARTEPGINLATTNPIGE
ncbi:ABC transporter substrate-binding protein [Actinotalea sp. M2MS4P-6]|uniref:ABC transporter substrate-binding protein n=1 Tax=Actinotalea sp. M2MS4P-6 TaxID=2983762 RepID=UPI0021E4F88B|nr:ABC transporter substrate-binding protein [Actinotalea sp. M2MS4P-6]MCV2394377.1 ABC transporter substrate-binding protein [Actinotalea sp. M2MS4P-6]